MSCDKSKKRKTADGQPARHLGELWQEIQKIAEEEDPGFRAQSVVEHSQSGAEGLKDVERWIEIYRMRVDPEYTYRFPAHHPRHRGYCLIPRNWPTGALWEAFDDATLLRLPVPGQASRELLVERVDAYLDGSSP